MTRQSSFWISKALPFSRWKCQTSIWHITNRWTGNSIMFVLLDGTKKTYFFRIVVSDLQDKVKCARQWPNNLLTDLPDTGQSCSRHWRDRWLAPFRTARQRYASFKNDLPPLWREATRQRLWSHHLLCLIQSLSFGLCYLHSRFLVTNSLRYRPHTVHLCVLCGSES